MKPDIPRTIVAKVERAETKPEEVASFLGFSRTGASRTAKMGNLVDREPDGYRELTR